VFSLKRTTAGVFAVPFAVLNRKKYDRRLYVVLELVPLRGGEKKGGGVDLMRSAFCEEIIIGQIFCKGFLSSY